jgi:hypothetical protein
LRSDFNHNASSHSQVVSRVFRTFWFGLSGARRWLKR